MPDINEKYRKMAQKKQKRYVVEKYYGNICVVSSCESISSTEQLRVSHFSQN